MAAVNRRQTIPVVAAEFAAETEMDVKAIVTDPSNLKFKATVEYVDGSDTVTATLCNPSGAPKIYGDLDGLLRDLAKAAPGVDTINIAVDVSEVTPERLSLTATPDSIKAANNAKWNAVVTRQTAVLTKLDAALAARASWEDGNSLQQEAFVELTTQRATANAYKTFATAQIVA